MQHVAQAVRTFPRAYWYLWLAMLINRMGNFVVPFLALYLTRVRHLPIERTGLIVAMFGAGSLAAGPCGGLCADRFGRRRTMLTAMVCAACTMLVLGASESPLTIGVAVLTLGFFADLMRPAMYATIADVVPPEQRPHAYGLLSWAINLGFAISPVVAGAVSTQSFAYLFVADAVSTLACAFVIWRNVPETRPARSPEHPHHAMPWVRPFADRIFAPFVALTFATSLLFYQGIVALPLDMSQRGISPATYGLTIALNGVLIVLLQPVALTFIHHLSRPHTLATGAFLTGVGMGLTAFATTPLAYAGTIAIWTLGEIALAPIGAAVVADLAPLHLRGCYQGAFHLASGCGGFFAPLISSFVLGHYGSQVLWAGCLGVGLIATLGHVKSQAARIRRIQVVSADAL